MTPQPVSRAEAIRRAMQIAARPRADALFIGIDGRGAAGKSTLAADMAAAVQDAVTVHVDDFWGPSIPEWDWGRFNEQVAEPLRAGHDARYQEWDWDLDIAGRWHEIGSGSVVIVEGVSATRDEVGLDWALTIWVEAPRGIRLARALERDGPELMHRWHDDWMPSEERYIADQCPDERADLIVLGVDPASLRGRIVGS